MPGDSLVRIVAVFRHCCAKGHDGNCVCQCLIVLTHDLLFDPCAEDFHLGYTLFSVLLGERDGDTPMEVLV